MYEDLRSNDEMRQIMALTELSEYLSLSSEDALVSFPIESFTTTLIQILEDPGHGDDSAATAMLLACRCLFSLVDILPTFGRIIVAAGGLPVLCAKLLNIEFIDVAELAVQVVGKIAEEQPLSVLKAGGAQAVLAFLDFFAISVQRQAVSAAATMLQAPPPVEVFETHIRPVLPTLATLLQHSDPQVLQVGCECWRRVCDHTVQLYAKQRPGSGKPKTTVEERNAAAAAVA
jgi:E3 ubiquitin-protein ligase TRIP12